MDNNSIFHVLALGDSYTIGEGVPLFDGYPYQAVQILRKQGYAFAAPEIIARTGWTTDELDNAISDTRFLYFYDFVILLIGVNNQYRGRSSEEYAVGFLVLLQKAIDLAAGRPDCVFVLSIPDWGVSPFAAGRDRTAISGEIDAFNSTARRIAGEYQAAFIDITSHSRSEGQPFASDGLHPAAPQYRFWAGRLAEAIAQRLSQAAPAMP